MNKNELISELEKVNIEVTEDKLNKLEIYKDFLLEYNKHTNLTAIKDEQDVYLKHFYDSLTIAKVIDLNCINNLLDVGSGAGFPGMVIKIFYPSIDVTLLDSNNKKITFLKELSNKLDIKVNLVNERVEEYSKHHLNSFDIVTSRAVANLRVLSEISLPLVKLNGYFIPMKGNIDIELKEAEDTIEIMNGKIVKIESFDLYNNNGIRNILLIEKSDLTYESILRKYDKILKNPLKK